MHRDMARHIARTRRIEVSSCAAGWRKPWEDADDAGSKACRDGPGAARGPQAGGNYVPYKISGNTLYLSGQGPRRTDGTFATGKVGRDVTVEQAYEHAKLVGLGLLAAAKAAAGELSGSRC